VRQEQPTMAFNVVVDDKRQVRLPVDVVTGYVLRIFEEHGPGLGLQPPSTPQPRSGPPTP
jgi:hypothetical protein